MKIVCSSSSCNLTTENILAAMNLFLILQLCYLAWNMIDYSVFLL